MKKKKKIKKKRKYNPTQPTIFCQRMCKGNKQFGTIKTIPGPVHSSTKQKDFIQAGRQPEGIREFIAILGR